MNPDPLGDLAEFVDPAEVQALMDEFYARQAEVDWAYHERERLRAQKRYASRMGGRAARAARTPAARAVYARLGASAWVAKTTFAERSRLRLADAARRTGAWFALPVAVRVDIVIRRGATLRERQALLPPGQRLWAKGVAAQTPEQLHARSLKCWETRHRDEAALPADEREVLRERRAAQARANSNNAKAWVTRRARMSPEDISATASRGWDKRRARYTPEEISDGIRRGVAQASPAVRSARANRTWVTRRAKTIATAATASFIAGLEVA